MCQNLRIRSGNVLKISSVYMTTINTGAIAFAMHHKGIWHIFRIPINTIFILADIDGQSVSKITCNSAKKIYDKFSSSLLTLLC